jgi:hypothetical protein
MAKVSRSIKIRIRRPLHIVLALAPSSEKGKPPYKICLDRHNLVFCTCKGWRYNGHTCRHLTDFRQALASAAEQLR